MVDSELSTKERAVALSERNERLTVHGQRRRAKTGRLQMGRFSSDQAKAYWEHHAALRAPTALERDPDALDNVCCPGAPRWLNTYFARSQEQVFEHLLDLFSPGGHRALDIGCGAGRWCRRLAARGFSVTGIDLQPELIAENQGRHPDMSFYLCPIQEFTSAERYDLVSCVTVLAHIPAEEQPAVAQRIRSLINPGAIAWCSKIRRTTHLTYGQGLLAVGAISLGVRDSH